METASVPQRDTSRPSPSPSARVQLAVILHGHLPFVRHPEHPLFHEETWLFEAILECYLPLLRTWNNWDRDGLPGRLTFSVSPTLAAMLQDELLLGRFRQYLARLEDLAEREELRAHFEPERRTVAGFHREWLRQQAEEFHRWDGQLLPAFRAAARSGRVELITCSATHAILPLLIREPANLRSQLRIALESHARWAGEEPAGFWLPECAWTPELEPYLLEAGIRWFLVETHGMLHASPRPRQAIFAPLLTPGGLAVFGRDPASARQVWSRHGGYPGDPRYREFHQDVAHDSEWEYVRPYLHGAAGRAFTGLKFHRVTGDGREKELYQREQALQAAAEHAAHFLEQRVRLGRAAASLMSRPPLIVAPYDAELFGHWWFEGPEFLDAVVRTAAAQPSGLELVTPSEHLAEFPDLEISQPAASTWGEDGHLGVWLDDSNAWIQPRLHAAGRRFEQLADIYQDLPVTPLTDRLLRQAARELLLAQASDWPFLIKLNTAGSYPSRRVAEHLDAFEELARVLEAPPVIQEPVGLRDLEIRHTVFADLDWRHWIRSQDLANRPG